MLNLTPLKSGTIQFILDRLWGGYWLQKKFDKMKEFKIIDTKEFVKAILDRTKLFRYECSDKNGDPSKKSR